MNLENLDKEIRTSANHLSGVFETINNEINIVTNDINYDIDVLTNAFSEMNSNISGYNKVQSNDEIWYWSSSQIELKNLDVFEHIFENGKGIIRLNNDLISINQFVTRGANDVTKVSFPNSLISFSNWEIFRGWQNLETVVLPNTFTSFNHNDFRDCPKINFEKLPDNLTYMGYMSCFSNCSSLTLSSLPSGVTEVATFAFSDCPSIRNFVLENSIRRLNQGCFRRCQNLSEVRFLGKPVEIYKDAFEDCSNLLDIYVPWSEGEVANAPWDATNATIHYNSVNN